jgi:hypothetical protein
MASEVGRDGVLIYPNLAMRPGYGKNNNEFVQYPNLAMRPGYGKNNNEFVQYPNLAITPNFGVVSKTIEVANNVVVASKAPEVVNSNSIENFPAKTRISQLAEDRAERGKFRDVMKDNDYGDFEPTQVWEPGSWQ